MYFDLEDFRPDITPVGQAISWREGILISIIFHLAVALFIQASPKLFPEDPEARARARARQQAFEEKLRDAQQFVFVEPLKDIPAPKPPARADLSDKDREARSPLEVPKPLTKEPRSKGNTPERVEAMKRETPRGQGPAPEPAKGDPEQGKQASNTATPPAPDASASALQLPGREPPPAPAPGAGGRGAIAGGLLGDALRDLQRYVQADQFENEGGTGQFGPAIQFDTKGVEFGPWIRRFIAQIKRNWFVPYAAMSMKGHVVITFNVHRDGTITDLTVAGPCPIEAFNYSAYGAMVASNPTQPLPPEYPSDHVFFTVTFFYNETPP